MRTPTPAALLRPPGPPASHVAPLRWPLPALLVWIGCWALWAGLPHIGMAPLPAAAAAVALGLGLAWRERRHGRWRATLVAAGFPLSAALLGAAPGWPAWSWLLALAPLALVYPLGAWRDAPWYPTPAGALEALATAVDVPPRRVLDAGCGLGHGLSALAQAWPLAEQVGVERSRTLAWIARLRCRRARVVAGDMWRLDWSGFDVVYVFQRPESMARAWAKACAELPPGGWLISLEFEVPGVPPSFGLQGGDGRPVWGYRLGRGPAADSTGAGRGR